MKKVYFDNAATTPIDPQVIEVMLPLLQNGFGNPSSIHSFGREIKSVIETSRRKVAQLLNVSPGEICFTSGGTEADNMAIHCGLYDLGIKHFISSKIEHHAVLHTLQELEKKGLIKLSFVDVDNLGRVNLEHLENLLQNNEPSFVSLMHANNEIGTLISLEKVSEICAKYKAVFHSDTVQTMGHYPMNLSEINIDFVTCAAHKFHGPKGCGFLYINKRLKISPFIHGGSQERNRRGGTENIYGIAGLAKALEIALEHNSEHQEQIQSLKNYFIQLLEKEIPNVAFNGDAKGNSLYTVLSVSLPPHPKSSVLLFSLDLLGIAVSGGSACSSGSDKGSHVLQGINAPSNRPAVRFSFSKYNTKEDVDYCIEKLKEFYANT